MLFVEVVLVGRGSHKLLWQRSSFVLLYVDR